VKIHIPTEFVVEAEDPDEAIDEAYWELRSSFDYADQTVFDVEELRRIEE
jgi:hypothetical protein